MLHKYLQYLDYHVSSLDNDKYIHRNVSSQFPVDQSKSSNYRLMIEGMATPIFKNPQ